MHFILIRCISGQNIIINADEDHYNHDVEEEKNGEKQIRIFMMLNCIKAIKKC